MTTSGTRYTRDGVKRFQGTLLNEATEEKVFAGRFTFHDLRAYYATQHKDKRGALPDLHANPATTTRVYDRNKIVKRCEFHFVEFQNKNGTG
ncbi:integrase [Burkholderia aenigmatica]|uniref:integrase n=1 Tax=Burkholderia aenigmatica TaxID=2015348 RepID=UPI002650219E|nr:integrase [Burkholderia aenigmatica]MDN7880856.1 integrase [Burkholderia aenigmatica]